MEPLPNDAKRDFEFFPVSRHRLLMTLRDRPDWWTVNGESFVKTGAAYGLDKIETVDIRLESNACRLETITRIIALFDSLHIKVIFHGGERIPDIISRVRRSV